MILQHLIDSASQITYRSYTTIGFLMGTLSTLLTNHLIDITMAFVIGASGALGAAFVKYAIDKLKSRNVKEEEEKKMTQSCGDDEDLPD